MGNHIHLLAVPQDSRALARTIGLAHARHLNAAWGLAEDEAKTLRQATRTGRPCGGAAFVKDLETALARPLAPQKRGPKPHLDDETPEIPGLF